GVHQPLAELLPPSGARVRGAGEPGVFGAEPLGVSAHSGHGSSPKAKRVEYRVPDPSSNPYLAFAAMLMAGIDGIKNRYEPPEPIDKDLYELTPEEQQEIVQLTDSPTGALNALEEDND